jgi:hypothetical protein
MAHLSQHVALPVLMLIPLHFIILTKYNFGGSFINIKERKFRPMKPNTHNYQIYSFGTSAMKIVP